MGCKGGSDGRMSSAAFAEKAVFQRYNSWASYIPGRHAPGVVSRPDGRWALLPERECAVHRRRGRFLVGGEDLAANEPEHTKELEWKIDCFGRAPNP